MPATTASDASVSCSTTTALVSATRAELSGRGFATYVELVAMGRERRLSVQAVGVVGLLAEDPGRWRFGYEMLAVLGLKSGSLYPILMRLEERGLLEARWDDDVTPGRPPRHLYRLTPDGLAVAGDLAQQQQKRTATAGGAEVVW